MGKISFSKKIKEAAQKQLEVLDLSNDWGTHDGNELTEIPEEVFKLKNLKVLKLNHNKITFCNLNQIIKQSFHLCWIR